MIGIGVAAADDQLVDACGEDPGRLCRTLWDATGSKIVTDVADWLIKKPLEIAIILVAAWVINRLLRRAIDRFVQRARVRPDLTHHDAGTEHVDGMDLAEDLAAVPDVRPVAATVSGRATTLSAVLRGTLAIVIWTAAAVLVLDALGVNLGALALHAGIAGVALGFGAQTLVKDCIAGFFILYEDHFAVGDMVDLGPALGIVESLSLRATVIRSFDGAEWTIPNGSIARVSNRSRVWNRAAIRVTIPADTDITHAQAVLQTTVDALAVSPEHGDDILDDPAVFLEYVTAYGPVLQVVMRVRPETRIQALGALRTAAREALAAEGIRVTRMATV